MGLIAVSQTGVFNLISALLSAMMLEGVVMCVRKMISDGEIFNAYDYKDLSLKILEVMKALFAIVRSALILILSVSILTIHMERLSQWALTVLRVSLVITVSLAAFLILRIFESIVKSVFNSLHNGD